MTLNPLSSSTKGEEGETRARADFHLRKKGRRGRGSPIH